VLILGGTVAIVEGPYLAVLVATFVAIAAFAAYAVAKLLAGRR
jgi:hypothetical protein